VAAIPQTSPSRRRTKTCGFTDWWLDERYAAFSAPPPLDDREAWRRWYVDDATLALDFFRYTPGMRSAIRDVLRFKAEHNLRRMGWHQEEVTRAVPAMA
jgi:hypothetical protein